MRAAGITRVEPTVQVVNVVASGSLKHGIDIEAISKTFPETEYKPEKFPGLLCGVTLLASVVGYQ